MAIIQGLAAAVTAPVAARVEREAWVMGTRLRIVTEARLGSEAIAASEDVLREIERVERVLSTWDTSSEMGRANAGPVGQDIVLSHELGDLLAAARILSERTGRAFDPVIGALLDAWGLRGEGRTPAGVEFRGAVDATGPGAIRYGGSESSLRRLHPGAWIDTGAFGKGAALRSAARLLTRRDVDRALIDLGGQFWAADDGRRPWTVDVAHPLRRHEPVARLRVHGVSVATSGNSERPGHLLDPRTGRPLPAWGSVTVVCDDPLRADALSTALYVMGPDEGRAWAEAEADLGVLFLDVRGGLMKATWTHVMEQWLTETPSDEYLDHAHYGKDEAR